MKVLSHRINFGITNVNVTFKFHAYCKLTKTTIRSYCLCYYILVYMYNVEVFYFSNYFQIHSVHFNSFCSKKYLNLSDAYFPNKIKRSRISKLDPIQFNTIQFINLSSNNYTINLINNRETYVWVTS